MATSSRKSGKAALSEENIFDTDVVIVGGGPTGCCLAVLMAQGGVRTVCIDKDDPAKTLDGAFDGRTTALSFASQKIMDQAGVWDVLKDRACPIEKIDITENGSRTLLDFQCRDAGEDVFGWIVENRLLRGALYERMKSLGVVHIAPASVSGFDQKQNHADVSLSDGRIVRGRVAVGADGKQSFLRDRAGIGTRGHAYNQTAIACVVCHEHPHGNVAIEDFRKDGPFAILPMADDETGAHRSSIVWTEHGNSQSPAIDWDVDTFNAALRARFPKSYGDVRLAGRRFSYPLSLIHAYRYTADRLALAGDAAHAIHPIAGQGLNLGLRDVTALADLIVAAKNRGDDIGSPGLLNQYERLRRPDVMAMAGATDTLNRIFSNEFFMLGMVRKKGLSLIQKMPAVRRFFMRHAMGLSALPSR